MPSAPINDGHTNYQIEAQSRELDTQQNILIDQDIDLEKLASVMNQGMNHVEVIPFDSEEFVEVLGYSKPHEHAQLVKVVKIPNSIINATNSTILTESPTEVTLDQVTTPFWKTIETVPKGYQLGLYDQPLASGSIFCSIEPACQNLSIGLDRTELVYPSYSASNPISSSVVSLGLGYQTKLAVPLLIEFSASEEIPYNKSLFVEVLPRVEFTSFDIQEKTWLSSWKAVGFGEAIKPTGGLDYLVWIY